MEFYPNRDSRTLSDSRRRAIPEDLKQDDSWVLWRYVLRDGKWTKEPYQANRRRAKTNDPQTWTTFERAVEAYEQDDFFDGIGFVFHDGNPFAGADRDGVTEDQAQEWMDRFDSYAERSPSGDGFHIIIKAKLPEGTKRDAGELYSSGRFFTVTGDVVRDAPIRHAQHAADEYYAYLRKDDQKPAHRAPTSVDSPDMEDDVVLRLLMNSANGTYSKEVYDGRGDFPSSSERDQSLANRIAFFTQDEDQIERIMRTSGCRRKKWDEHRTYLKRTINKAIDGLTNTYAPAGVIPIRTPKKDELAAGVRDLRRRWWDQDWTQIVGTGERAHWMRGYTCRDVMKALIDTAETHGRIVGNKIEVGLGRRKLALRAATSLRTVHKAVKHLEAEGWLESRPPESENEPGVYVLGATLHQALISTRAEESVVEGEGGGEDLHPPRLRWSAPYERRLGKHNCAIIDHLVREGDMRIGDLAGATNRRPQDLRRRNLPKLAGAGIVFIEGDTVRLAADWRGALERRRDEDGEIAAEERDRKKYREQSENYRSRDKTPADEVPPLMGPERVGEIVRERAKEDLEVRIEEQRRKVGMTAAVFLADEMAGVVGVRLGDVMDRWQRKGGQKADLWRAARNGPYRFRREVDGEQYVEHADGRHEDAYDRKVAECMRNLGEKQDSRSAKRRKAPTEVPLVDGEYRHGQECDCDWCAA
jgi:hypothetical protein